MSTSDMIIASIGDAPYVLGIAFNSIIGRKIISGGNKNDTNCKNIDTIYLPNGLVQMPDNIQYDANSTVKHSKMQCNDISDDLYDRLLALSNSYPSEPDIDKPHVKSASTTGKNKNNNRNSNKNISTRKKIKK